MADSPSAFALALRLNWLDVFPRITGQPSQSLRDWVADSDYSFPGPPSQKNFEVFVSDLESIVRAFAFDANRMSCSSFESILSISPVVLLRRSLAWLSIKSYYAAFYAAHAFIRYHGVSCTQLDSRETSRLAAVAQAYGFSTAKNISTGFYTIALNSAKRTVKFENGLHGGGSHETLWVKYTTVIRELLLSIESSDLISADKVAVSAKLDALLKVLTNASAIAGSWPSRVRNEINYRHGFGVWYPHSETNDVDYYMRLIRSIFSSDPSAIELGDDESFESFVRLCFFIVNMTRVTAIDMARLHGGGKSFQEAGPMVILRRGRMAA
jgi:hypothetical protein